MATLSCAMSWPTEDCEAGCVRALHIKFIEILRSATFYYRPAMHMLAATIGCAIPQSVEDKFFCCEREESLLYAICKYMYLCNQFAVQEKHRSTQLAVSCARSASARSVSGAPSGAPSRSASAAPPRPLRLGLGAVRSALVLRPLRERSEKRHR